ncbi:caspase-3-like isoform X2 [Mytilus edulis]|uniref:caspase-3-like isoform X2 n=1 Tax=Mytilus edulis TaxID=6550 RepID=UPI0039EEFF2B
MKPSQQKNDSTREDVNVKTDQRRKKLANPSANQIGKNKKKETKTAQVVELHLGTTVLPLKDARGVLSLIEQLKTDQKYSATLGFLSDLFRKLNTLEDGQFSRIEIDMTVRQYQDYTDGFQYRLTVKPVGYCLLITNSEFYQVPGCPISKKLPNRPGVEGDAKRLEGLMSTIGYKVLRKDNLKKWEIEREMKAMAEADHKKFDCFVCIISSHGTANKVYGSDGYDLMLGPQLKRFTVDACPDLDGKPKIFLFQACNIETEDKMQKTLQPLINETDFLYGFSTLPGNLAYNPKDGKKTGSYYLYSLYKHLSDKYKACDLVAILEDMNRELAEKKSELRPGDLGSVTMFVDCLRGHLFFQ